MRARRRYRGRAFARHAADANRRSAPDDRRHAGLAGHGSNDRGAGSRTPRARSTRNSVARSGRLAREATRRPRSATQATPPAALACPPTSAIRCIPSRIKRGKPSPIGVRASTRNLNRWSRRWRPRIRPRLPPRLRPPRRLQAPPKRRSLRPGRKFESGRRARERRRSAGSPGGRGSRNACGARCARGVRRIPCRRGGACGENESGFVIADHEIQEFVEGPRQARRTSEACARCGTSPGSCTRWPARGGTIVRAATNAQKPRRDIASSNVSPAAPRDQHPCPWRSRFPRHRASASEPVLLPKAAMHIDTPPVEALPDEAQQCPQRQAHPTRSQVRSPTRPVVPTPGRSVPMWQRPKSWRHRAHPALCHAFEKAVQDVLKALGVRSSKRAASRIGTRALRHRSPSCAPPLFASLNPA